jgi:peptidoglycan/LPS O-acetylase OafA/YrhL
MRLSMKLSFIRFLVGDVFRESVIMVERLTGPGTFRYFLATLVLVAHSTRVNLGSAAVYIFFTLSGYWITVMWQSKYSKTENPYFTYLVSRFWRLLPLFWICGVIALLIQPWHHAGSSSLVHYWGSQIAILGYHSLDWLPILPAWSLDVEMQFYLLAPLAILVMTGGSRIWTLFGIAVGSALASKFLGENLASCAIFFAIGIVAAQMKWRPGKALLAGSGMLVILGVGVCLAVPALRSILCVGTHPGPLSMWNIPAQITISFLAIPYAIWTTSRRSDRVDKTLADASYALYLLHWPLLEAAMTGHLPVSRWLLTGLLYVATIGLSIGMTLWIDNPIQKPRSRWVNSRSRRRTTSPVADTAAIEASGS